LIGGRSRALGASAAIPVMNFFFSYKRPPAAPGAFMFSVFGSLLQEAMELAADPVLLLRQGPRRGQEAGPGSPGWPGAPQDPYRNLPTIAFQLSSLADE